MSFVPIDIQDLREKRLNVDAIRDDFPALHQEVRGKRLAYLDNAATTQKPRRVLDAVKRYYERDNSNVHRGVHTLSMRATDDYEASREKVRHFIGADAVEEIIFTRGTTESINLVAQSYARTNLKSGDEILITYMEHHSNIVPWQILCEQTGAQLKVVPINDRGELVMDEFRKMLSERTKIVSVVQISNALGTINPVNEITQLAHEAGAIVLVDGAQATPHVQVDVKEIGCDFYAFSGHKVFGPTGIGVLYGRKELLDAMPPYQGGGDMIRSVSFEKTTYNALPYKFEAGTPHISGAIGLGAALDYVNKIGLDKIALYEARVLQHATEVFSELEGVRLIGTAAKKASVLSFVIDGVHPHDAGSLLDQKGIAVRAGHHCTQPVMQRFNVPATTRASLAVYNTIEEIDALAVAVKEVYELFR